MQGTGGKRKPLHLTEEQQRLAEENINLVYFYAEKFVKTCNLDKEEIQAVMMFGLCKACATWNPARSKLSTYATRCMRNELFMRLRQEKRWRRHSYLSDIAIKSDRVGEEDDSASWEAFMYDKEETPLEEKVEICVTVERLKAWLSEQEEYMNPTTLKVVQIWLDNPQKTQADLAKITEVSQAQVSRILTRVKKHIISVFFRGDDNWLYGGGAGESELSNEFVSHAKKTEEPALNLPEIAGVVVYREYPIVETEVATRVITYQQLAYDFQEPGAV